MTLMRVKALTYDSKTHQAVAVLADATERRGLGFLIPTNEADRLARALGHIPCPCVPIFELVQGLLAHFEARILRVVLDGNNELGVSSTLCVEQDEGEVAFPCHPADALALALRAGAPIYATPKALLLACSLDQPHRPETCHPDVTDWLERVRPDDFEG